MKSSLFGISCERKAYSYLKGLGYEILNLNYKNKIGEIDIIAKDGNTIVFVEVKGRLTRQFGDPLEAINMRKQNKIRQVATVYLIQNNLINTPVRFDAISVLGEDDAEIRHIKNAF